MNVSQLSDQQVFTLYAIATYLVVFTLVIAAAAVVGTLGRLSTTRQGQRSGECTAILHSDTAVADGPAEGPRPAGSRVDATLVL